MDRWIDTLEAILYVGGLCEGEEVRVSGSDSSSSSDDSSDGDGGC